MTRTPSLQIKILDEPLLEFGNGAHACPKVGIESLSVYDINEPLRRSEIRLGIVGRGEGIDLMDIWLSTCENGIEAKDSKSKNLFRGFGGLSKDWGFHTKILHGSSQSRPIQKTELNKVMNLVSREEKVSASVELYFEQLRFLAENRSIDVCLCVIPDDLFESLTRTDTDVPIRKNTKSSKDDRDPEVVELEHNFRRQLKARSMHLRVPLQLMREKSLIVGKTNSGQQDDATRAWNFCTAIYYKGNKSIPWRLQEERHKPKSCYVGIGFYQSRDKKTISTSLAQVFDEFGHGVILRGSPVSVDKDNRRPYMDKQQAFELLDSALQEYDHALMHMPARIVIHKTSNFRQSEIEGFQEALDAHKIRLKDFVTVMDSKMRLFSYETYPPVRGTLLTLSESKGVLYTRGYIDHYKTYPGMYVPNPLEIRLYEHDSSLEDICKEVLGLTKMNWNNTQMDGKQPITVGCAQSVGEIMKYVDPTEKPQVNYAYYM